MAVCRYFDNNYNKDLDYYRHRLSNNWPDFDPVIYIWVDYIDNYYHKHYIWLAYGLSMMIKIS